MNKVHASKQNRRAVVIQGVLEKWPLAGVEVKGEKETLLSRRMCRATGRRAQIVEPKCTTVVAEKKGKISHKNQKTKNGSKERDGGKKIGKVGEKHLRRRRSLVKTLRVVGREMGHRGEGGRELGGTATRHGRGGAGCEAGYIRNASKLKCKEGRGETQANKRVGRG